MRIVGKICDHDCTNDYDLEDIKYFIRKLLK